MFLHFIKSPLQYDVVRILSQVRGDLSDSSAGMKFGQKPHMAEGGQGDRNRVPDPGFPSGSVIYRFFVIACA